MGWERKFCDGGGCWVDMSLYNRDGKGLRGTLSWSSRHTETCEMRMVKNLGRGRLVCTPVLGSGHLGSQRLLSKFQEYQMFLLISGFCLL